MAESVTYADLRFVKVPLKKRISSHLGQDPEADDDGELTYENVQVPPISGGATSLASSGLRDNAGVQSEPPTTSWSSVTSPAARRLLGCRPVCSKYLLLGLLLACLLLGVAAISLGVRYLQVSQQLQRTSRVLEATNSSLRQQLRLKSAQLGQREEDLQGSRRELAQSQEALRMEQKDYQAVSEQLQTCLSAWEQTKETLKREEDQRRNLEEQKRTLVERLRSYFLCPTPDTCCPVGWILKNRNCFYISLIKKSWEESQSYCRTHSSSLATYNSYSSFSDSGLSKVLKPDLHGSYWIDYKWKASQVKRGSGYLTQNERCIKFPYSWPYSDCTSPLPFICEMAAFGYPDEH